MSHAHRRKQRFKLKSLYIWHRYLGVSAAFFTLVLTITGILLNHTEEFRFDEKFISSDLLLNWYNITAPTEITTFDTGTIKISQVGELLYFDEKILPGHYDALLGAVSLHDIIIIAVNHGLSLFTNKGELVEQLKSTTVDLSSLTKIGRNQNHLIIDTDHGLYSSDTDFLRVNTWQNPEVPVRWSTATQVSEDYSNALRQRYRNDILPMERVLLDLHSGRIVGIAGVWAMDIAAFLLILLSLTGTWMWLKRRR